MNLDKFYEIITNKLKCFEKNLDEFGLGSIINTIQGHRIGTYVNRKGIETDFFETITHIVDNQDGTFSFINEDGEEEIINTKHSTIIDNEDGTSTITTDDGNSIVVQNYVSGQNISVISNILNSGHLIATHFDGNSITKDILETITSLYIDDTNLIYIDEAGNLNDISLTDLQIITTLVDNEDGTYTYTSEDGTVTIIDITSGETITTLVDNGDGTFTYTNEENTEITVNTKHSTIIDNGDGTSTIIADDGSSVVVNNDPNDTGNTSVISETISGHKIAKHFDGDDIYVDINETVTSLSFNSNNDFLIYTDENGDVNNIDISNAGSKSVVIPMIPPTGMSSRKIAEHNDGTGLIKNISETKTIIQDNTPDGDHFRYINEEGIIFDISKISETGETITTITDVLPLGNLIGVYHNENNDSYNIYETITVLNDNNNGTYTYTSEDNTQTIIDIKGNETITTLIDNNNGTYTYTSEDGTVTIIDIKGNETITYITQSTGNEDSDVNNGSAKTIAIYTNENNENKNINETVTEIQDNTPDGDHFRYINEKGIFFDISKISSTGETITNFTDLISGHQIGIYHNEDNNSFIINETTTVLVNNNNGSYTYTNEEGNTFLIDIKGNETITTLIDNNDGTYTYTSEDGTITVIDIKGNETVTHITQNIGNEDSDVNNGNANTIATYTNENNENKDINETVTFLKNDTKLDQNGNEISETGWFVYENEKGDKVDINYNSGGGTESLVTLLSPNNDSSNNPMPQRSIAKHSPDKDNPTVDEKEIKETITRIEDNTPDGDHFTYINEEGVSFEISKISTLNETITTLVDNNNGTYTYTSEDGTITIIDIKGNETITTLIDNNNGTYTYTSEDGTVTVIDIKGNETVTEFTDLLTSGNLIGKYHNEEGTIYDIKETITTLIDNNDGTYTYTSEDGTITTINSGGSGTISSITLNPPVGTLNQRLIATHNDGQSTPIIKDIKETITIFTDNNATGNSIKIATYKNENDVEYNLWEHITEITDTLSSGHLIGIYHNEVVGATPKEIYETITTLIDNNDGTYTYTSEDGTQTIINSGGSGSTSLVTLINANNDEDGISMPQRTTAEHSPDQNNPNNNKKDIKETITRIESFTTNNGYLGTRYVNEEGIYNVILDENTGVSSYSDMVSGSYHKIGEHKNGLGVIKDVNESISTLHLDKKWDGNSEVVAIGWFVYRDENGTYTNVEYGSGGKESEVYQQDTSFYNIGGGSTQLTSRVISKHTGDKDNYDENDSNTYKTIEESVTLIDTWGIRQEGVSKVSFNFVNENGDVENYNTPISEIKLKDVSNNFYIPETERHQIARFLNNDNNITYFPIYERVTKVEDNVPDGDHFTYTDENGNTTVISKISSSTETITYITQSVGNTDTDITNGDARTIAVYTNENNEDKNINETITKISISATGHIIATYTNEDGNNFSLKETNTNIVIPNAIQTLNLINIPTNFSNNTELRRLDSIATYYSEDGDYKVYGIITKLKDNNDGTFSYFNEIGEKVDFNGAAETVTHFTNLISGNLIGTYINEDNTSFDVKETITVMTINSSSGGSSDYDTHQIASYTSEDGTGTSLDETVTKIFNAFDGDSNGYNDGTGVITKFFDYNSNNLNVVRIGRFYNENVDSDDFTYSTLNPDVTDIFQTITSLTYDGTSILTYTDEVGDTYDIDLSGLGGGGTSSLIRTLPKSDNTLTYDNGTGTNEVDIRDYVWEEGNSPIENDGYFNFIVGELITGNHLDKKYIDSDNMKYDASNDSLVVGSYTNPEFSLSVHKNIYIVEPPIITETTNDYACGEGGVSFEGNKPLTINDSGLIEANEGVIFNSQYRSIITTGSVHIDKSLCVNETLNVMHDTYISDGKFTISNGYFEVTDGDYVGSIIRGNLDIDGDLDVTGNFTAASKQFKIEHPTDNTKFLYHSCVEGNERFTFYRGRVTTDSNGDAIIILPDYFEDLNISPEYQLTVIGKQDYAYVNTEVNNNRFSIKTLQPNTLVSWLVTGIRNDTYSINNPFYEIRNK